MRKNRIQGFINRSLSLTLCAVLSCGLLSVGGAFAASREIKYDELESLIKAHNIGVESANNALSKAVSTSKDYTEPNIALYNQITMVQNAYDNAVKTSESLGLPTVSMDVYYGSQLQQLQMQLDNLGNTSEKMADAVTAAKDAVDRVVAGQLSLARTNFIGIHISDKTAEHVKNTQNILIAQRDRAKRLVDAGFAPASSLDAFKLQEDSIKVQIDNAKRSRDTYVIKLKAVLGLPLGDSITIGKLPDFDLSRIDKISYNIDLLSCLSNSLDIKQKQRTYTLLWDDRKASTEAVDKDSAKLALEQAKLDAEVNFRSAYEGLVKSWAQLKEDKKAIDEAKTTLAKAEKQLSLGLIPASTVTKQKEAISSKESAYELSKVSLALQLQTYDNMRLGV